MIAKLGVLAGGGDLPATVVQACRKSGREVFVLAFEGQTDPETLIGVEHSWSRLGAGEASLKALKESGVEELVLAGPIKRPSLSALRPDLRTARFFAKLGARAFGDDGMLSAVISLLEEEGFRVLGVDQILSHLVAQAKCYGRVGPDDLAMSDIRRGFAVAKALGAQDVGQAVVVQQGVVLALEAIEGTDALLRRCVDLRGEGPGGVLVKARKPGQESRVDLPTIGRRTVEGATAAGLRGIAVEAGCALVMDEAGVVEAADASGLFVIGLAPP